MVDYAPEFAKSPVPNHEGECQFVRTHRYLEACSLPGCKVGRMSRDWMEEMARKLGFIRASEGKSEVQK